MGAFASGILPRLRCPIIVAPMAGGISTPALVAATAAGGGLGFVAAGYRSAEAVRAEIAEVRSRLAQLAVGEAGAAGTGPSADAPFGVNIFVPSGPPVDPAAVAGYAQRLAPEAERYGAAVGTPPELDTDDWAAKLDLVVAERVPVVSFTFGCPSAEVVRRLQEAGSCVVVTVTSVAEALAGAAVGVDALCVQGPEAGGHRATFPLAGFASAPAGVLDGPPAGVLDGPLPGPTAEQSVGLLPLLTRVRAAVGLDLVASGGIMTGAGVAAVLAAGACAAQLGTAFLLATESGTNPIHRAALTSPDFPTTTVTEAFTGRPARGLTNRFMREYDGLAPADYPYVHHLTSPLRKAAAAAGDPHGMAMWAGQGFPLVRAAPAAELLATLTAEARAAADRAATTLT